MVTKIFAIIGGVFVTLLIIGVVAGAVREANKPTELSSEARSLFSQQFASSCVSEGGDSAYCSCAADKVAADLDTEKLEYMNSILEDETKLINFLTPYANQCVEAS